MNDLDGALRSTSEARDLCLSLKRAFVGPGALSALRERRAATLTRDELLVGLGLAWAARDLDLMRSAFAALDATRVASDAILRALHDAAAR